MIRFLAKFVLSSCFVLAGSVSAETKVPNTFTAGSPAKASEVNENFSKIASAVDEHWSRYPDRYYPDWRYEPSFYITLPTLGGFWKGRLLGEYPYRSTSARNLNFVNRYDSSDTSGTKRVWLGINVVPSVDVAVSEFSKLANGSVSQAYSLYKFDMSHNKDGSYASISYSKDSSLDSIYGSSASDWRLVLSSSIAQAVLTEVYRLLKLNSAEVAVSCTEINIHQNADRSITATGTGCVEEIQR